MRVANIKNAMCCTASQPQHRHSKIDTLCCILVSPSLLESGEGDVLLVFEVRGGTHVKGSVPLLNKDFGHLGLYVAFYEIYCGKLFDLLNNRQILHARENAKANVVIVGLQEHAVKNVQDLMEVIDLGLSSRTTGVTGANVDSSRSHESSACSSGVS